MVKRTQVAQSSVSLGLGHDLTVHEFETHIRLSAISAEPSSDPLSPFLSAPPCSCSLSLSFKNKHLKIKIKFYGEKEDQQNKFLKIRFFKKIKYKNKIIRKRALYKENGNVSRHHNKLKIKLKPNQYRLHKYGSSFQNHKVKEKQ